MRRSRLPPGAPRNGVAGSTEPAEAPPGTSAPAKDPRVFRLAPADARPVALSAQTPVDVPAPVPARPRRGRRASPDRRPGPVTQVLKASPRPAPRAPAAARAAELATQLSRVAPVLAEIEQAQGFWFMDDGHEADWQRLLQRAAALARELKRRDA